MDVDVPPQAQLDDRAGQPAVSTLSDAAWSRLLARIASPKHVCTPFIGAGASADVLPSGRKIAAKWAAEAGYPLSDANDLTRVAQFLAVTQDPMAPKEQLVDEFAGVGPPAFDRPDEPHRVLAELPFPVYLTTNYDDFMVQALRSVGKTPIQEACRWNSAIEGLPSVFDNPAGFTPTPESPIVFHLHGHLYEPESMVLTEDDYLDFMVRAAQDEALLPPRIQEALRGASLLFFGYRVADWNFRVIFRSLVRNKEVSLGRTHVSVQIEPRDVPVANRAQALAYLEQYFKANEIAIYWGEVQQFALDMRQRWEARQRGS